MSIASESAQDRQHPNSDDEPNSYHTTKRWFPKHPELGPPGIIGTDQFVSQAQFDLERRLLWPRVWLMVGRVEQVANPGDYFIKEIPANDVSLIIVRGRDNVVRAFHNICSHRGSQLCLEKSGAGGSRKAFSCPYHGFVFGLDGQLIFAPDEGNFYTLERDKAGLTAVALDIWAGFIFVHLDPNPRQSLRNYLGAVVDGIEDYPFHDNTHCRSYTAVLNCNWKVVIAAFSEGYHAKALHLRSFSRMYSKDNPEGHTYFIELLGPHHILSFYHNPDVEPTRLGKIAYARTAKFARQAQVAADQPRAELRPQSDDAFRRLNSSYLTRGIFPNLKLNLVRGSWFFHQWWPLAVDKVLWEVRMFFPKPRNASEAFFQDYSRYTSRDNLSEDANVAERQQMALKSGVIDRWLISDEEIAIQHFNKYVTDYTAQHEVAAE